MAYAVKDFYCQNPSCGRKYTGPYPKDRKFCPECVKDGSRYDVCAANKIHRQAASTPPAPPAPAEAVEEKSESRLESKVKELLHGNKAMNGDELADALDCGPSKAKAIIESMTARGYAISRRGDGKYELLTDVTPGGTATHDVQDRGDGWTTIGIVSDNHLGSKHTRLDVLSQLYDIFEQEGVKHVYNCGNWIEGESRVNRHDIAIYGMTAQVDYFIHEYPQRNGITTFYVAGDDHEGWYVQRELVDIGQYAEDRAHRSGRKDLKYIGYMESDVKLQHGAGSVVLRVQHGGGGCAYALSYTLQKMIESFQGGEKPTILAMGHHHKFDYCYPRNVHAFMPGCTQDQSMFMRKKKIEAHVGGVLLWLKQDPADGHVTRFRAEWIPFYDRGFYEKRYEISRTA